MSAYVTPVEGGCRRLTALSATGGTGELSFARNGGFASVRGPLPRGGCAGASGLVFCVKGGGETFKLTLQTEQVRQRRGGGHV